MRARTDRGAGAAGAAAGAPVSSCQGVGLRCPMVNDSVIVALNLSVMWKNSTFTDSSTETPAEKPTSIGA